jgi:hypothetical protein
MEKEFELLEHKMLDVRQRLVNRVAACLIKEPAYYQSGDERVHELVVDMNEVLAIDPEFLP